MLQAERVPDLVRDGEPDQMTRRQGREPGIGASRWTLTDLLSDLDVPRDEHEHTRMVRRRLANDFTGELRGRSARNRKQAHQKERRFARYRAAVAPTFPPRNMEASRRQQRYGRLTGQKKVR